MGQAGTKKKKQPKFKPPTSAELKVYLMSAQGKMNIYRTRKVTEIKNLKKQIAAALSSNNIMVAKAKMETIIRGEDYISVYDCLGPICEILKEKVTFVMDARDCPPELHT